MQVKALRALGRTAAGTRGRLLLALLPLVLGLAASTGGPSCGVTRTESPYTDGAWQDLSFYPLTQDGVIVDVDGRSVFHPAATIQSGIAALARGDLATARTAADALLAHAEQRDDALLLPYHFDFEWYGRRLTAPWYSGLAQGQALSLLAPLYTTTGDDRYLAAADRLYATLRASVEGLSARVDGSWWIVEYPVKPSAEVFNGHMFGIIGVWDYWQLTGRGAEMVCDGLATVRAHIGDLREPGDASWYDVQHTHQVWDLYHPIHVWQLRSLARLGSDPSLAEAARLLDGDYP